MNSVAGDVAGRNVTTEGVATKRLAALDDLELIARWAALRVRLAYKHDPEYSDVKAEYGALAVEYRRRIEPVAS